MTRLEAAVELIRIENTMRELSDVGIEISPALWHAHSEAIYDYERLSRGRNAPAAVPGARRAADSTSAPADHAGRRNDGHH